jgi:hypothetical protein
MIRVTCPTCGTAIQAGDDTGGKATRCPKCREPIRVPGAAPAPPADGPLPKAAPPAPAEAEPDRPRRRGGPVRAVAWALFLAWAGGVALFHLLMLHAAESATQQAAASAEMCFWLILGYTVARALDSVTRS